MGDVAADRIDLVLLDERVELAAAAAAVDRQVDHGVLLADRVERLSERLDVDDDRQRLDAAVERRAVADAGNLALRAQLTAAPLPVRLRTVTVSFPTSMVASLAVPFAIT